MKEAIKEKIERQSSRLSSFMNSWSGLLVLFFLCVASRLLTSIHYPEDPDSLRFALAVKDYDIAALQPHFPGYPVYVFAVKLIYLLTGKLFLSFALIGGMATFALVTGMNVFARKMGISSLLILFFLVFFNPLFWLMSNRLMPDLAALAVLVWCLALYCENGKSKDHTFFFLAGLLAGIRLSYLPFLVIPFALKYIRSEKKILLIVCFFVAIASWFIPMLIDTGYSKLVEAATTQTSGHFYDWGGSVITDPDFIDRLYSLFSGVLAHGLGLYWPGRSLLTSVSVLILLFLLIAALMKGKQNSVRLPVWVLISMLVYLIWVFFFQNILFNPRHLMPVVLILVLLVSVVLANLKYWYLGFAFLICYSTTTLVLTVQHKSPSAIYQATLDLRGMVNDNDRIISTETVNFFLDYNGVKGEKIRYAGAETKTDKRTFLIGNISANTEADSSWFYYHNPYVNLIWPEIQVRKIEKE